MPTGLSLNYKSNSIYCYTPNVQHDIESILDDTHLMQNMHQTGGSYSRICLTTALYAVALTNAEHENGVVQ